jgi:hypothetical protein
LGSLVNLSLRLVGEDDGLDERVLAQSMMMVEEAQKSCCCKALVSRTLRKMKAKVLNVVKGGCLAQFTVALGALNTNSSLLLLSFQ